MTPGFLGSTLSTLNDTPVSYGTQVPLIAPEPPPVHYQDRAKVVIPSLPLVNELQPFIYEHSELRGLRLCTRRQRCRKRICKRCSTEKATAARDDLRRHAAQHATVVNLTLSISSSTSLAEAWNNLATVRKTFTRSRWLAERSTSFYRQTEVTHTDAGWHLHDCWLIWGTPEQQNQILDLAIPRWNDAAKRAGLRGDPIAQHANKEVKQNQVIGYVVKGLMNQHETTTARQGRTPGDLLALFHAGDADAAEAYTELERAFLVRGRRWVERGGNLRGQK